MSDTVVTPSDLEQPRPRGRVYAAHEPPEVSATDRQDDAPSRCRTTRRRRVGDASTS